MILRQDLLHYFMILENQRLGDLMKIKDYTFYGHEVVGARMVKRF